MSFLRPTVRGVLPLDLPPNILDRLEASVLEGRFMAGVHEIDPEPLAEPDYRVASVEGGALRLKKKGYTKIDSITLRMVRQGLHYEVHYSRRNDIVFLAVVGGLITVVSLVLALADPWFGLKVGLAIGGFVALLVGARFLVNDIEQRLVEAVREELRAAELEERIRNEVLREVKLQYRVASEDAQATEDHEADRPNATTAQVRTNQKR